MKMFRVIKSFIRIYFAGVGATRRASFRAAVLFLLLCAAAAPAAAHPMGNFAVCHFSAIRAFPDVIKIHYIIDIAEVPTYHQLKRLDTNSDKVYTAEEIEAYGKIIIKELVSGLTVEIDGEPAAIRVKDSFTEIRDGLPGLKVTWVESNLEIPFEQKKWPRRSVTFRDSNFPDDMGWKEIKVFGSPETRILEVSELSDKNSNALTEYPENMRADAPKDLEATFVFGPGAADVMYAQDTGVAAGKNEKKLTGVKKLLKYFDVFPYLEKKELSTNVIIIGIAFAFILGCFHAVAPGHGKTLVAAYLVGTKGKFTDALLLGVIVTFTHVAAVVVMFIILLSFWERLNAEVVYAWLGVASGAIIIAMGAWIFYRNLTGRYIPHAHDEFGRHINPADDAAHTHGHRGKHDHHDHEHDHHDHEHEHHDHEHEHHDHRNCGHDGHSRERHNHGSDHHDHPHPHDHEHDHEHDSHHCHNDHEHDGHHAHDSHKHGHSHDFEYLGHEHPHPHDHHQHEDHDNGAHHDHNHGGHPHGGRSHHAAAHAYDAHTHEQLASEPAAKEGVKFMDLLTLGITGGIVPCPTAIIILFAAIGLNRLAFGLMLMISFSIGLAFVLILIGLMIVGTRNMAESRFSLSESRLIRFLPYVSATLITLIGIGIAINGLKAAGIL